MPRWLPCRISSSASPSRWLARRPPTSRLLHGAAREAAAGGGAALHESPRSRLPGSREEVLRDLQGVVDRWAKQLTRSSTDSPTPWSTRPPRALLLPFGSYRLGVHGRGSDIDALVVASWAPLSWTARDQDFFVVLAGVVSETEGVTHLHPVPGAHVPVMKLRPAPRAACRWTWTSSTPASASPWWWPGLWT
ncbi:hypothetical protein ACP4OV_026524 [Aristida adscensionis]